MKLYKYLKKFGKECSNISIWFVNKRTFPTELSFNKFNEHFEITITTNSKPQKMKKKKHLNYLILVTIAFLFNLEVQGQAINGTLHSPTGDAISGATVTVKGTNNSVVSDNSGKFSISAPVGSILVISSVGYQQAEITATGTDINEVLQVSNSTLNEVV